MIAFLIALAPLIPVMLSIAGFFIQMFGTSKANLDAYQAMIQQNKDAGLITVDTYTKLNDFHKQMREEYERKQAEKSPAVDSPDKKL